MSTDWCDVCGTEKKESPVLLCAPCLFSMGAPCLLSMVKDPNPVTEIVTDPETGRSVVTWTWERK